MDVDYTRKAHARLFQNDFLELTSKVHPAVPFVVYIPVVVALLAYGLATGRTTPLAAVGFYVAGWIVWDVAEYAIHRGFFHWEGNGPFTRKIHDIIHGYHHHYPDDPLRLVMPLGASIPLALLIGGGLYLVGAPLVTIPLFAGFVSGYLWYDFVHYSTHARTPRTRWGREIRSHHMAHHFACPDRNYGISHRWIDALVGSTRKRDRAAGAEEAKASGA